MTPKELAAILASVNDFDSRQVAADALEEAGKYEEADLLRWPTNQVCIFDTRVFMLMCTSFGSSSYFVSVGMGSRERYNSPSHAYRVAKHLCDGNLPGNVLHLTKAEFRSLRRLFREPR